MPEDNEVESYWDHREGIQPPTQESRNQWNPSGQQVLNILTRVFADPPPEYICQTEHANLIITHLTRQYRSTNEYPDYETVRRTFEGRIEPGCVQLLDRVVQGILYSRTLTAGELWEHMRRMYQSTPTNRIPEIDRQISAYVLEYCKENHAYPQISIMRGHFISNMRIQERILNLIVIVGGLDGEIPSPGLPQEVQAPREEGESPAPSQLVLDLRRLALLLSDIQDVVDRIGDDNHIDSIITELFHWVESQGATHHMSENWWDFTLENFEVTYRLRRGSVHQRGSHAYDSTAADRRILAYNELYMNMVGHLPSQVEVREYFTSQNDGPALTRLDEINRNEPPVHTRPRSPLLFGHPSTEYLELPERLSDAEMDYDLRINLRRVALLLDGLVYTSERMSNSLNLRVLHDLQISLRALGERTFNSYLEPDWHNQTLRDFRIEFLHRGAPGVFPRPLELYPTERHAYPPPMDPITTRPQERVAEDNRVDGPELDDFSSLTNV